MAIYGYTKNYKLIKPEYDSDTWHDYEYNNLDTIDAVLSSIFASNNWRGFWANNTAYAVGDVVIDKGESKMYQVLVAHTTDAGSTFYQYRTANPTYYQEWNANKLAKDWADKTSGPITDIGVTDYSSKAYAIGGVGTETNNSKYYSQQASASEAVATTKANEAGASASAAATSETNAKTSELNAKQSEVNAKSSETIAKAAQDDPNVVAVGTDLRATDSAIKKVAADISDVSAVAMIDNEVVTVSSAINQVITVAGIKDQVVTTAEHATVIQQIGDNINTVLNAPQDAEKSRIYAYGTDAEVQALGGVHSAEGWAKQAQAIAQISDATESISGVVRLATEAEALAGVNDTKAMTPLKATQVITANVGRGLQLGFNGTLTGNVLTFEPDQSAYEMKQGYDYEIDLLFPAAGTLPDSTQMVIKNGADTVQIVNVKHADASTPMTYGDMKQMCRYDAEIGWRWIFNARYSVTDTGVKVLVMPSAVIADDRYVTTNTPQTITAHKNISVDGTKAYSRPIEIMMPTSTNSDPTADTTREIAFMASEGDGERYEGSLSHQRRSNGMSYTSLRAGRQVNGVFKNVAMGVELHEDGLAYGTAPNTPDNPINTAIVTAGYLQNNYVDKTSAQTITGRKTFNASSDGGRTNIDIVTDADKGNEENGLKWAGAIQFKKGDEYIGYCESLKTGTNISVMHIVAHNTVNGQVVYSTIETCVKSDGTTYGTAPTPPANVSGNEIVTAEWLRSHTETQAGSIIMWGGTGAPEGEWLPCNGAAISRTTYARLFSATGTKWGAGDGSTTFNTPNLYLLSDIKVKGYTALGLTTYSAPNVPTSDIGQIYRSDQPSGATGPFVMFNQAVQNQGIGLTSDVNSTGLAYEKDTFPIMFYIRY